MESNSERNSSVLSFSNIVSLLAFFVACGSLAVNFGRYQADWASPDFVINGQESSNLIQFEVKNVGNAKASNMTIAFSGINKEEVNGDGNEEAVFVFPAQPNRKTWVGPAGLNVSLINSLGPNETVSVVMHQAVAADNLKHGGGFNASVTCEEGVSEQADILPIVGFGGVE